MHCALGRNVSYGEFHPATPGPPPGSLLATASLAALFVANSAEQAVANMTELSVAISADLFFSTIERSVTIERTSGEDCPAQQLVDARPLLSSRLRIGAGLMSNGLDGRPVLALSDRCLGMPCRQIARGLD